MKILLPVLICCLLAASVLQVQAQCNVKEMENFKLTNIPPEIEKATTTNYFTYVASLIQLIRKSENPISRCYRTFSGNFTQETKNLVVRSDLCGIPFTHPNYAKDPCCTGSLYQCCTKADRLAEITESRATTALTSTCKNPEKMKRFLAYFTRYSEQFPDTSQVFEKAVTFKSCVANSYTSTDVCTQDSDCLSGVCDDYGFEKACRGLGYQSSTFFDAFVKCMDRQIPKIYQAATAVRLGLSPDASLDELKEELIKKFGRNQTCETLRSPMVDRTTSREECEVSQLCEVDQTPNCTTTTEMCFRRYPHGLYNEVSQLKTKEECENYGLCYDGPNRYSFTTREACANNFKCSIAKDCAGNPLDTKEKCERFSTCSGYGGMCGYCTKPTANCNAPCERTSFGCVCSTYITSSQCQNAGGTWKQPTTASQCLEDKICSLKAGAPWFSSYVDIPSTECSKCKGSLISKHQFLTGVWQNVPRAFVGGFVWRKPALEKASRWNYNGTADINTLNKLIDDVIADLFDRSAKAHVTRVVENNYNYLKLYACECGPETQADCKFSVDLLRRVKAVIPIFKGIQQDFIVGPFKIVVYKNSLASATNEITIYDIPIIWEDAIASAAKRASLDALQDAVYILNTVPVQKSETNTTQIGQIIGHGVMLSTSFQEAITLCLALDPTVIVNPYYTIPSLARKLDDQNYVHIANIQKRIEETQGGVIVCGDVAARAGTVYFPAMISPSDEPAPRYSPVIPRESPTPAVSPTSSQGPSSSAASLVPTWIAIFFLLATVMLNL